MYLAHVLTEAPVRAVNLFALFGFVAQVSL